MKKIKKLLLAPVVFLTSFLFSRNVFAGPVVYGPPVQTLYGMMPVPDPIGSSLVYLLIFPLLPLIALVALIVGIIVILKKRDKKNPGSNKKSIKKIIIMVIGFIIFLFLCLVIRNFSMQTLYGIELPPNF
jgi:heme/copper-type cytochrome/quinol oxidase subunit 2